MVLYVLFLIGLVGREKRRFPLFWARDHPSDCALALFENSAAIFEDVWVDRVPLKPLLIADFEVG